MVAMPTCKVVASEIQWLLFGTGGDYGINMVFNGGGIEMNEILMDLSNFRTRGGVTMFVRASQFICLVGHVPSPGWGG
jgi:hypothetical protein